MTEEEAIDILKSPLLKEDGYERHQAAIDTILDLYYKQQRIMKSQEKIIMEQEKEIDKYKKQEFGNLFNGRYISKDKIRDKIKTLEEKIHIVIPNQYNQIEVINEFKNEGALNILEELLLEE